MTLGKLWPTLLAVATLLATTFAPTIQHAIAGHPTLATALAAIYAIGAHFMPSPAAPPA
jgi:predicted PhzF superfamily epimerase YddE/YHI9